MVLGNLANTMLGLCTLFSLQYVEFLARQGTNSPMASRLLGMLLLVFGAYAVISRQKLARKAVDFYRKSIGVAWPERVYEISYYIGGVAFSAIGALLLFGIIKLG